MIRISCRRVPWNCGGVIFQTSKEIALIKVQARTKSFS